MPKPRNQIFTVLKKEENQTKSSTEDDLVSNINKEDSGKSLEYILRNLIEISNFNKSYIRYLMNYNDYNFGFNIEKLTMYLNKLARFIKI